MSLRDAPSPDAARAPCPRCGAPDATLKLLTSMTRYFVCPHCNCRWQVSLADNEHENARGEADDIEVRRRR